MGEVDRTRITELLAEKGRSTEWLADSLGVSRQSVWRWRKNPERMSLRNMRQAAKAMDVLPEVLFGDYFWNKVPKADGQPKQKPLRPLVNSLEIQVREVRGRLDEVERALEPEPDPVEDAA